MTFWDDPTVNRLQERCAAAAETAVFVVPVDGNQTAIRALTGRGRNSLSR
jgi:hypothetical protein